ncbi:hypothetical protein ACFQY7_47350 [Actinomadura luteofluorescens]|uniref:hypothetical protein n=1 Tax=Actinomadura luteofluorescens TaxID=46163 RepID=UPI003638A95B
MITAPRHATTYSLFVPDEAAAREGARALAGRGHALVRVAPDTTTDSGWRVDGLDEGPYPDDDERWWAAAEHRAVAALAEGSAAASRARWPFPRPPAASSPRVRASATGAPATSATCGWPSCPASPPARPR